MTENQKTGYDVLYLSVCGVLGKTPDLQRVRAMNLPEVYKFSIQQTLDAICYMAMESTGELSGTLAEKWKERKNKVLRNNLLFTMEREKLFAWMEEAGCWYLPLKGIVMETMYPHAGMRQMGDNDILFDPVFQEQVRDWFQSQGYEVILYKQMYDDVYQKKPVLNFEMHTSLFDTWDKDWMVYWTDVKDRLVRNGDGQYGYHMKDEDYYLYMMTHSYKHFLHSGTGLKILLDSYVLLKSRKEKMDFSYIKREAKKLGIEEYESEIRTLTEVLFSHSENFLQILSEKQRKMLGYFLNSGNYGNYENSIRNSVACDDPLQTKASFINKIFYLKKRFFLSKKDFEMDPDLRPFAKSVGSRNRYRIRRWIWAVHCRKKAILRELKIVFKCNKT